jgi:hypothetical protein
LNHATERAVAISSSCRESQPIPRRCTSSLPDELLGKAFLWTAEVLTCANACPSPSAHGCSARLVGASLKVQVQETFEDLIVG